MVSIPPIKTLAKTVVYPAVVGTALFIGANTNKSTQVTEPTQITNNTEQKGEDNRIPQLPFAVTTAMACGAVPSRRYKINQRNKNGYFPLEEALKELSKMYNRELPASIPMLTGKM